MLLVPKVSLAFLWCFNIFFSYETGSVEEQVFQIQDFIRKGSVQIAKHTSHFTPNNSNKQSISQLSDLEDHKINFEEEMQQIKKLVLGPREQDAMQ